MLKQFSKHCHKLILISCYHFLVFIHESPLESDCSLVDLCGAYASGAALQLVQHFRSLFISLYIDRPQELFVSFKVFIQVFLKDGLIEFFVVA